MVLAKGAGAEMRTALGVAVFRGMLGVTIFGLMFTPAFYTFIRRKAEGTAITSADHHDFTTIIGERRPS